MAKLSTHRTLIAGISSPILAAALGAVVYMALTRASVDRDADFVFRLTTTAIAMAVPFVVTLFLAMNSGRWRERLGIGRHGDFAPPRLELL